MPFADDQSSTGDRLGQDTLVDAQAFVFVKALVHRRGEGNNRHIDRRDADLDGSLLRPSSGDGGRG